MIVAVDIGGTKTLVVLATNNGKIIKQQRFLSVKKYSDFVKLLSDQIKTISLDQAISLIIIGCAGTIDREKNIVKDSPNLGWINKPLGIDISKHFNNVKTIIENDANLAGLSEAHALRKLKQNVLYVTFGTGVGTGYVSNGILVPELLDSEGGHMVFRHEGKMLNWEAFSAGRAIVKKYGKKASELNDPAAWRAIAESMAIGIVDNCAVFPANTVVIGGGVGTYFKKYVKPLKKSVKKLIKKSIMLKMPKIVGAKNAEKAVILGCLILARDHEQHR